MPTKKPAIPGIKRYFEPKAARWYNYHRKTGTRIEAEYGTDEFVAEVARINATITEKARPTVAKTLGELIVMYRAVQFEHLAARTRADYQKVFDYLKPMSDLALESFTSGGVVKLRDKAFAKRKRRFANYVVAVLSILFEFAREREFVTANPVMRTVKKIRRPKGMEAANRPWLPHERAAVLAEAPIHLLVPIALCAYIGLREGDALIAAEDHYDGTNIAMTTSKAGVMVWWRAPLALKAILDRRPRSPTAKTLALTSRLSSWTQNGFRASWQRFRKRLERDGKIGAGLTIHGLRHSVATYLREEGFEPRHIADALAQKQEGMALHYSKTADLRRQMEKISDAIDRRDQNEQRTKAV